jgi:CheY-like chemotaxis protein
MALEELSEAKRRNEELAARAIAADQDKTRFMARMSHDLRTPLAAVLGSIELALTDPGRDDIIKLLRAARERSTDLQRLVGDLVDVESAGSSALCVIEKPIELSSWLEQVKCEARPRAGVSVELECDPKLPLWVRIDPTRVAQILANLIDNACKHTDSGRIVLRAEASDGRLRLSVIDTGPGIDAADLAMVGLPFRQLERGRERGGTGLGLYSAGQIARVVGGSLTLSSAPGSGTQAVLELPLVAAIPQPAEARKPMRLAAPLTVLFADDEPVLREITTAMLESIGCTVLATDSGLQVLAHASAADFDAVLLDIVMPDVDGLETARRLRAQYPTLPLIAMTANAFPEDARIAAEAGFNQFLTKPVTPDQLYDVLTGLFPTTAPRAGG